MAGESVLYDQSFTWKLKIKLKRKNIDSNEGLLKHVKTIKRQGYRAQDFISNSQNVTGK